MRTQSQKQNIRKIHLNKCDCCGKGEVNCCVHYMTLIFCLYQLPPPCSPRWERKKRGPETSQTEGVLPRRAVFYFQKAAGMLLIELYMRRILHKEQRPNSGIETHLISGAIYQSTEKAVS